MVVSQRALFADGVTRTAALAYAFLGGMSGAFGAINSELRHELGLSRTVSALHGAMFGWGLLVCALAAGWIVRAISIDRAFVAAIAAMGLGTGVLAAGHHVAVTIGGAAIFGLGGGLLVLVTPQIIAARHGPDDRTAAFVFVNGVSIVGTIGVPVVLALTLHESWGWRGPMFALALIGSLSTIASARRSALPSHGEGGDGGEGGELARSPITLLRVVPAVRSRWAVLVLGISIEFGALLWGSVTVQDLAHASASTGALAIGLFSAGMVLGRFAGPRLVHNRAPEQLLRWSFAAALAISFAVRLGPGLAGRVAGLFVLGLAIALIYPLAFSRLYGVDGLSASAVGALGALASGTAISLGPAALGALADGFGLARALLILPVMSAAALVLLRRPH
jgi:predicted MFS family arabinose efflux permease